MVPFEMGLPMATGLAQIISMSKKNVLLLIADDWSPIAGCYGNSAVRMPNIDRFAENAVVFDRAYCVTPSCAASRASLLTGLHSHANGQYGHTHGRNTFRTLPNVRTVPEALREAGVYSGIIGKQHVFPPEKYPFEFPPAGTPDLFHGAATAGKEGGHIRDQAKAFFAAAGDRQFYLHIGFSAPHRKGRGGFDSDASFAASPEERTDYEPDMMPVPNFLPDHPLVREDLADYYRALTRLDHFVGYALDALQASGRMDDTMVILMSDHGMPFPGAKATSFESGHRCPLIVWHSGLNGGMRNPALVNWVDIAPTILEWMGLEAWDALQGRSFLPVLDNPQPEGWERTFFSHNFHGVTEGFPYRVICDRRYKYVRNLYPELTLPLPSDLYGSKTWHAIESERIAMMGKRKTVNVLHQQEEQLFDLENDPAESINLADEPEHRERMEAFRRDLLEFQKRTGDLWLDQMRQFNLRQWRA